MYWQAAVKLICRGCLPWSAAAPAAGGADQVVGENRRPHLRFHHFWRLAPQEGRLTCLFALIGPAGQIHDGTGRQRHDRRRPGDRQADAGLLGFCLRILLLVCRRVRHGEREAVDELRVMCALPQPARIGCLLQFLGHFAADRFERLWRKLGPGTAGVAGIFRGRFLAPLEPRHSDAGNRRLTGGLLPVAEHLRQKRPEHDGRRVDTVLTEQAVVLPAEPLDAFGRHNLAEGRSLAGQKHVHNPTQTTADSSGRSGYLYGHEKTLLGFSPGSEPRRASSYRQGQGITARSTSDCKILKNPLRQPKANLRAHFGTTVPFVAVTFFAVPRDDRSLHPPPPEIIQAATCVGVFSGTMPTIFTRRFPLPDHSCFLLGPRGLPAERTCQTLLQPPARGSAASPSCTALARRSTIMCTSGP